MRVCPGKAAAGQSFDNAPILGLLQCNITGAHQMIRFTIALVGVLLLAACTDMGSTTPQPQAASAGDPMVSGVGHPSPSYPGPRAY
jgi:hypothetical protein